MEEVVRKYCKKHGELPQELIQKEKNKEYKCGYMLRCALCRREKKKRYYYGNQDKCIQYSVKWKAENRERANANERKRMAESPERRRNVTNNKMMERYSLTIDQYEDILNKQNGVCAICKREEERRSRGSDRKARLAIDHCHGTNKLRELLCHNCNAGIGHFKDNIETMYAAIEYIKKHKQQ